MASIPRLAGVFVVAGAFWVAAGLVDGPLGGSTAWAQSKAIQTQESNVPGVTFEITEVRRKEGVLTIRLKLVNSRSADSKSFGDLAKSYVTAGKQKYQVLQDTAGTPLAAYGHVSVPASGSRIWWAKFPAPGPDVKMVSFFTPETAPFEDVPISD